MDGAFGRFYFGRRIADIFQALRTEPFGELREVEALWADGLFVGVERAFFEIRGRIKGAGEKFSRADAADGPVVSAWRALDDE